MRSDRRAILVAIGLVAATGLAGCSTVEGLAQGAFTADGRPKAKYLVGGGMQIVYIAPADGNAYWVEETTGKIIMMKSLTAGERAEFGAEGMDPDVVKETIGVDLKDARFTLYFIPIKPAGP